MIQIVTGGWTHNIQTPSFYQTSIQDLGKYLKTCPIGLKVKKKNTEDIFNTKTFPIFSYIILMKWNTLYVVFKRLHIIY